MQPKMPDCCAAPNCDLHREGSNVLFFRFPLDAERCKQWLNNCRRQDLASKTPEQLHKLYRLCANHFEPSLICPLGMDSTEKVLKEDAIPTIFIFSSHSNNPLTHTRKRTIVPAEEELASLKKSKDDEVTPELSAELKEEPGESIVCESQEEDQKTEETPNSKEKEILKVYFKETLAFSGFSIRNDANPNPDEPLGGHRGQQSLNPICVEKIDQKEVLQFTEDLMQEEIRNSLRLARYFSILLQDVTNIEGKEQIPVFIRSVTVAGFPQKHLMGFLPCDADAESLFYMLLSEIRNKWELRMEHCRGLTYITTGSMCQKMRDLTNRILQEFPQVVLAPSDPYAFNIWLIRSMPIPSIQKVVNSVEEVAQILRKTPDLRKRLEIKIRSTYGHLKGEADRITEGCQDNWEYGIDAFQVMLEILEPFLSCINEMTTSSTTDADTAEQMANLKPFLKNFNFIMTLVVLKNTLCCVSILNSSLRGAISISSTLQYTISNALKLVNKYMQEIAILHRKWFSDAVGRAKKLGVAVCVPETLPETDKGSVTDTPLEDLYRETLSRHVLQYLTDEVKRVFSTEMVRILRWLSLVPSYMADHNFSIRRDKVADANLNNLARPDTFYDELGYWEVKWRHASKRRILPTTAFATLKIPDIGFYPNVQSLLRVLGTIPCVNAQADVYGQYNMVLERFQSYLMATPDDQRLCNMAFVFVNQDVHFNVEDVVETYVQKHPEILALLHMEDVIEVQPTASVPEENDGNHTEKEQEEETEVMTIEMETERVVQPKCAETDKEALKSALQAAVTAAYNSQMRQGSEAPLEQDGEVEYVSKSEMKEVLTVCEDSVREGILLEVGSSFFSLFIDSVVRLGETDYLPLFLRFVDSFDVMRLELMGFIDVDLDCDAMSERLFETVTKEWRLDLRYCRGQAYLGSGEVSYKLKAFACKIQEKYPLAICTHSSCYSFNTWWSKTIPVPSVKRALDTFEEVLMFFSSLPTLEKQLDHVIAFGLRESFEKIQELQGKFCTVWQEKHDSYEVFVQMLEPLVECLEKIKDNPQRWKPPISEQAGNLLRRIRDFEFIVPMVALKNSSSFTRELSAGLQKDHFSAASQLCQISGIVATLNRVKTNIKVFHQNWFDEACALAQSLGVQIKVPDNSTLPRDSMLKPAMYYKDALSVPLVDNLINAVKDHFSEDHKEALNFLSLVPCSVTVSYMFEILKSKPPLYSSDLPDADNFFTELCCWRVKWKTKVASLTIPESIFQTLRLPVMQYFGNINTLLRIMSVLPSTVLEDCGVTMRHKKYQEYLRNTCPKDRSPCLAMLQVGTNFSRDLDRMVSQCLKVTPQTLEGICLDKESKCLLKSSESNMEVDDKDGVEELEMPQSTEKKEEQEIKPVDENGHSGDNRQSLETVFRLAARLGKNNCSLSELSKEEQELVIQELSMCHWFPSDGKCSLNIGEEEMVKLLTKSIREVILQEIQESPFFSLITDRPVSITGKKYLPVFVRYVGGESSPKVELIGYLPFDENCDVDVQAKSLAVTLTEDWGLQMAQCRGQAFMRMGSGCQSLKKMSLDFLKSYPLSVITPSESCGLACWLAGSLAIPSVTNMLDVVEDLLLFFDSSPGLEGALAQAVDGLLNTPREALDEFPETCCSRWKKREDFFDILVDTFEGILSCLDSVSSSATGAISLHAQVLSSALKSLDFIINLVILKNACAPLRNCSTVFRCGNPADIICEVEKIPAIIETLGNMQENIAAIHSPWFEEAFQLASKVAPEQVCFPEETNNYSSPETYYKEKLSVPLLSCLVEEMKYSFSESHLKALKVLSLLPSCNPQPILQDSTDKLYSLYLSDLPDPDTAEQEISNWATVWIEKYQDVAPPASISETLLHPESKTSPAVTTLLRLVAVLPSVSMEWDLMKTTLNSMKDILKNTICKGGKTDILMLRMHHLTIQSLQEVIDKCIEVDSESSVCLSRVKMITGGLRLETEVGSATCPGRLQHPMDVKPTVGNLNVGDSDTEQRQTMSFYEPPVREEILKELWDSQFFTIITEREVDIEGNLYVPLCIRYLDKQDTQCEETVAFVPFVKDTAVLADYIETALSEKWGLNMEYCRGQAFLSVGEVGSQMKAVTTVISQKYPLAVRTVSSAVSLNVWLARSSPAGDTAEGAASIEDMLQWLTEDTERQTKLDNMIIHMFQHDEGKGNELRDKLINNWEKSHDMHEVMVELLEVIMLCLSELKGEANSPASRYLNAVRSFEFIFSTVVLKNVLSLTRKFSQSLQGKPLDVLIAVSNLPDLQTSLSELMSDIDHHHQAWFEEAVTLASKLQITMLHPPLLEPLSEFYKRAVSERLVEHVIAEVTELFTEQVLSTLSCLVIVPYAMSKLESNSVAVHMLRMYKDDLPDVASLHTELKSWKEKWLDPMAGYLPATVLDTLKVSHIRSFSNFETLLRLLVILPFSRKESTFRQGKRSLQGFVQQERRCIAELHPL
ncbi:uncharacterized protein si:dkey-250d21.1 [Osmerus mordax]|uniref:uncharacterized protein si:dkey-250d21.1 n=1 Tax=Osmerus mordax TaxID=8014 RepID=UPI00350F349D